METLEMQVLEKQVVEIKSTSQIASEFEDGTFDFMYEINLNRTLSARHVNALRSSILKLYKLLGDEAVTPIYVVKRNMGKKIVSYILDGQHRVKACLRIYKHDLVDINFKIITLDGDQLSNKDLVEVISTLNSNSVKWKNTTYVELFAKLKTTGYRQFLDLIQNKNKRYFISNMAHLYTGTKMGIQKIRKGDKLDIAGGNIKRKQFDQIVDRFPNEAISAKNLRAVTTILMMDGYDHNKFFPVFDKYSKRKKKIDRFPQTENELLNDFKQILEKNQN